MSIWRKLAEYALFETERLLLRPVSYEDCEDFYRLVSPSQSLPFIFPRPSSRKESDELLVHSFMREPLGIWAIEEKASQQMIGVVRLEKLDERLRQADLAYFLHQRAWGQGLMTEAVKNILFLAFTRLDLESLSIHTHLENQASQRVAEKAGFQLLGRYRGSDRYSHQMRDYLQFRINKQVYNRQQI